MIPRIDVTVMMIALSLGLMSCNRNPAAQTCEGREISGLTVRYTSPRTVPEARIRAFISSQPGDKVPSEQIDADVTALYDSGLVDDVTIVGEPDGDSVRLIAQVSTRRPIGPGLIRFVGNTLFSDRTLAKQVNLNSDEVTTRQGVRDACQAIERFYRRHGYRVTSVTARSFDGRAPTADDFVFVIVEPAEDS